MDIKASDVKILKDKTGAGLMECKKALVETEGDIEKAVQILREKGVAAAEKKSGRDTTEGLVYAYNYTGKKLGAIVEINCETDFVARTADFENFCKEIAMQIVAQSPVAVDREGISAEIVAKEKEIYANQIKDSGKPENIVEKIVQGKLEKFYKSVCLLEQPYIRDDKKTVGDFLKETISTLKENIIIRRFIRYELGEEI